jgi:hypothetical protein
MIVGGRIAHNENRRQLWIDRTLFGAGCLRVLVLSLAASFDQSEGGATENCDQS